MHQTSQAPQGWGIVLTPPLTDVTATGGQEDSLDADVPRSLDGLRCARCGRPGRFVRHTTLVHVRPRPTPRR